jgi:hypothetical protein
MWAQREGRGGRGRRRRRPTAAGCRSVGRDKPALGGAGRRVAGARDGGGAVREGDGVARGTMETGGRRGGARRDGHGDEVGVGLHGGAID